MTVTIEETLVGVYDSPVCNNAENESIFAYSAFLASSETGFVTCLATVKRKIVRERRRW